jgi:hypothetical protein
MSLLMGRDAGVADAEGVYPEDSINGRIQAALEEMADTRHQFSKPAPDSEDQDG